VTIGARWRFLCCTAGLAAFVGAPPAALHAQGSHAAAPDSASRDAVYLREGAVIRGQILADNGPNGIRIRSAKSGAVFVVPAAQVDSVVRPPATIESAVVPEAEPTSVVSTGTAASPAVILATEAPEPAPTAAPPGPVVMAEGLAPNPQRTPVRDTVPPRSPIPAPVAAPPPVPVAVPVDTVPKDTVATISIGAVASEPDTAAQLSTVTFISGTEVYIGAGRLDGLAEGSEVEVLQNDAVVATMRVKFLASHRSACEVTSGTATVALGDVVRYHRQAAPAGQTLLTSAAPTLNRPHRLSGPGLHGRFGTRYLRATTTTIASGQELGSNGFNQPSLDARINGMNLGGTPLGLALDLRTRQTTTTSGGRTVVDGHTRVYQAVMFWNAPNAKFRAAAGRQYLTTVSSIGLFDGALLEVNGGKLSFGAFAGFEPDVATLGFSGDVHDFGLYTTLHNRPGSSSAMSATLGAVGSYQGGEARREWGIAQVSVNNRYLSLYLLQELDYYRPWKLEGPNAESSAISGTSQFANVSMRATRWLAINATYDKRRSVPTIRDFTNPETEFDDTYRQGYGAGVQLTGQQVYGGGDWRRSTGGTAGGANSYTTTLGINRLTRLNLGLSVRATWYQNDVLSTDTLAVAMLKTSGRLYSGRLSLDPVAPIHIDLNAGLRQEDNPVLTFDQKSTWYGVDVDINLARAWFLSFSGLMQKDAANPGTSTLTQVYGGLTWRF